MQESLSAFSGFAATSTIAGGGGGGVELILEKEGILRFSTWSIGTPHLLRLTGGGGDKGARGLEHQTC